MDFGIYSYVSSDLNPEIIFHQEKIFKKFGLNINYITGYALSDIDKHIEHGESLSDIINTFNHDYFIFFDTDCIPLNVNFLPKLLNDIKDNSTLSGAVGCANHINKLELYVHSCFFGTSKKLFVDCGKPNLKCFENGDTAQILTQRCKTIHKKLVMWNPTESTDFLWDLTPINKKFGHGTVFENVIYHQFEIRKTEQQFDYIEKCKWVLTNSY